MRSLEVVGSGALSATVGTEFAERVAVVARDEAGQPLAGVDVAFRIAGDTDSRFSGGATTVTVTTGADGVATAPALLAGERPGEFTVRATVVGRDAVPGVDRTATVAPRQADALTRTGDAALTAAAGGEFGGRVTVKATHQGATLSGAGVTATMVAAADSTGANDEGPYFKDAQGNPVRTLTGLRTGADGTLQLPAMYADDRTGTYLLRLTAEGGATLTVQLTVG